MTVLEMYKRHLKDYEPEAAAEMSESAASDPRPGWPADIWKTTVAGHPVAIHIGEGINHYFHVGQHVRGAGT